MICKQLLFSAAALLVASYAAAGFDDFESFTPGQTINGQGEWTVGDSFGANGDLFDEEITDDGTGNQVWRISNEYTTTSFSNHPFSSKSPSVAGETGAGLYNDYGLNGAMPNNPPLSSATASSKFFHASLDFRSATGAAQDDISMAISAGASQSTLRQSFFRIVDSGAGFNVDFFDTTGSDFFLTPIATGLSYTDWHNIEMYIEFVDGIGPGAAGSETGNDVVSILINGSLVHTGTTWESFFYNNADAGIPAPSARAVDSLLFRQSGVAAPGNAGGGLYFDNVRVDNASIPEPTTLVLVVGCGAAAIGRRR